jgi:hypothetical protein
MAVANGLLIVGLLRSHQNRHDQQEEGKPKGRSWSGNRANRGSLSSPARRCLGDR